MDTDYERVLRIINCLYSKAKIAKTVSTLSKAHALATIVAYCRLFGITMSYFINFETDNPFFPFYEKGGKDLSVDELDEMVKNAHLPELIRTEYVLPKEKCKKVQSQDIEFPKLKFLFKHYGKSLYVMRFNNTKLPLSKEIRENIWNADCILEQYKLKFGNCPYIPILSIMYYADKRPVFDLNGFACHTKKALIEELDIRLKSNGYIKNKSTK